MVTRNQKLKYKKSSKSAQTWKINVEQDRKSGPKYPKMKNLFWTYDQASNINIYRAETSVDKDLKKNVLGRKKKEGKSNL